MLKQTWKKFKKEKGFTLVELLAVIAILGIIVAIAVPTIGNVISKSEAKAHEANVDLVENAARLAFISDLEAAKDGEVTLDELVSGGFLEEVPETVGGYSYSGSDTITVTESGATYDAFTSTTTP